MRVRITYRSEIYLEGDTMAEIKDKFNKLNLGYDDLRFDGYDAEYVELCSVEDAETYKDLMNEWYIAK